MNKPNGNGKTGRNFMHMLDENQIKGRRLAVSLDSDLEMIPRRFKDRYGSGPYETMLMFNNEIVNNLSPYVCAFIVNDTSYKAELAEGMLALQATIQIIKKRFPHIPILLNGCASDIGKRNKKIIEYAFGRLGVDGIGVNGYPGRDALLPFLDLVDIGVIVLARTSNPGAGEFQDKVFMDQDVPLHRSVAFHVEHHWNDNHNCGISYSPVGYGELSQVREIIPKSPIFVYGIGSQRSPTGRIEEDQVQEIITSGRNCEGRGIVLCASSSVIFAKDPQLEAERLHNLFQKFI